MKKIFTHLKYTLLLGFVLSICLFSCDSSSELVSEEQNIAFNSDLTIGGNEKNLRVPLLTFSGSVEFWNNSSAKELGLFFIDSNGNYNYILIEDISLSSSFVDGSYNIKLYNFGLVIARNSSPTSQWFIGLNDPESTSLLGDLDDNNTFNGTNLTGRSLMHSSGSPASYQNTTMSMAKIQYYQLSLFLGGGSGGKCDSGGPGSNSCSQGHGSDGTCSVSCKPGYYACCKEGSPMTVPSCTCKKG